MARLVDSPELSERGRALAEAVTQGDTPVALRCSEAEGRARLLASVLSTIEDAVHVYVPDSLDQPERVLLDIAQGLGPDVAQDVDGVLRHDAEDPSEAFVAIEAKMNGRPLIVDGWERLGSWPGDRELGLTLRGRTGALRRWLGERARLFVLETGPRPANADVQRCEMTAPPVQLANGTVQQTRICGIGSSWT